MQIAVIFGIVVLVLLAAFVVGRKIKPRELEEEIAPGVKPFIPSEDVAIFGARRLKPEDYIPPGLPELTEEHKPDDPIVENVSEEKQD